MRGIHGPEEHRGKYIKSEYVHARKHAERERHHERQQAEDESALKVQAQVVHIDLKPGEEHKVQQPHLPEDGERRIVVEYVEAVRPHHHTGNNHAYDVRNFELVQKYGRKEYDSQHDEEYLYGLRYQCLLRHRLHSPTDDASVCTALSGRR